MGVPDGYNTMPIENIIGKDSADNEFDSTLVIANEDGSVLERLEAIKGMMSTHCVVKDLAAADLTGTATRFTITGIIAVKHLGMLVTTALPAGANTIKFQHTPTGGAAADLCAATDSASAVKGQLFLVDGVKATALVKTTDPSIGVFANEHMPIVLGPGIITMVCSAGPPATGAASLFIEYEPLIPNSLVD